MKTEEILIQTDLGIIFQVSHKKSKFNKMILLITIKYYLK